MVAHHHCQRRPEGRREGVEDLVQQPIALRGAVLGGVPGVGHQVDVAQVREAGQHAMEGGGGSIRS